MLPEFHKVIRLMSVIPPFPYQNALGCANTVSPNRLLKDTVVAHFIKMP